MKDAGHMYSALLWRASGESNKNTLFCWGCLEAAAPTSGVFYGELWYGSIVVQMNAGRMHYKFLQI